MRRSINSPVNVTAVGFDTKMGVYPRVMEWAGSTYRFIDQGIRVNSIKGERTASTFTVSDGLQSFCLRFTGNIWTLLGVY